MRTFVKIFGYTIMLLVLALPAMTQDYDLVILNGWVMDPEILEDEVAQKQNKHIAEGIAILDAKGEAIVNLSQSFCTSDCVFQYLITALDAPMHDLHIAEEITENNFKISGGVAGKRVSWKVTGARRVRAGSRCLARGPRFASAASSSTEKFYHQLVAGWVTNGPACKDRGAR